MTNFVDTPWRRRDAHGDLVLEMRRVQGRKSGADDGVDASQKPEKISAKITEEIRVRHSDGHIVLDKHVTVHRNDFGQINAAFSDDGLSVVVTTSSGRDRVWPLK